MVESKKYIPEGFNALNKTKFRVAVVNYLGNTGKSIVSDYLLRLYMDLECHYVINNMKMYNKTYSDEIVLSGEDFNEVLKALVNIDSAIVDIAAHNTEYVIDIMQNNSNSHKVFDYFLVPVIKGRKESEDSLNTIKALLKIGVPPKSIKIIFNKNKNLEIIDEDFGYLLSHLDELKIPYDTNAAIENNPLYSMLSDLDMSLPELLSIPIEEKKVRQKYLRTKKITERTEQESEELKILINLITAWRYAQTAVSNLSNVYHCIFAKPEKH